MRPRAGPTVPSLLLTGPTISSRTAQVFYRLADRDNASRDEDTRVDLSPRSSKFASIAEKSPGVVSALLTIRSRDCTVDVLWPTNNLRGQSSGTQVRGAGVNRLSPSLIARRTGRFLEPSSKLSR